VKSVFSKKYQGKSARVHAIIHGFDTHGEDFDNGDRNTIKLFDIDGQKINVKSFKKPNWINKVVYRFFRDSKAERSFEYANTLLSLEVGTPHPVAYFEEKSNLFFGRSYYISEHLTYDLTYRELIRDSQYTGDTALLSAFAKFTYQLHAKGIHFLDHSPGNTLIKINKNHFDFYLVDLNRMAFGVMSFETRMKNFERLSRYEEHVRIMAKAYAEESGEPEGLVFEAMWKAISNFQEKFYRKKRIKARFKFWKS
jgi:hypothetical protein